MHSTAVNARFWVHCNGNPVKLTLREGQSLEWYHSGPSDEGWSAEGEQYTYSDGEVRRRWISDGRDCDGRLTREGLDRCSLTRLQAQVSGWNEYDREGIRFPEWQDLRSCQRDEYAEAMNY